MFFLNLGLGEFLTLFSGGVAALYLLDRSRRKQTVATAGVAEMQRERRGLTTLSPTNTAGLTRKVHRGQSGLSPFRRPRPTGGILNLGLGEFLVPISAGLVALYLLDRSGRKQTVATLKFWRPAEQRGLTTLSPTNTAQPTRKVHRGQSGLSPFRRPQPAGGIA